MKRKRIESKDLEALKERFWKHLKALEQQTGMPLRETRRRGDWRSCPIAEYAPDVDLKGRRFENVSRSGEVVYIPLHRYKLFDRADYSQWWGEMLFWDKKAVWCWLENKMREEGNGKNSSNHRPGREFGISSRGCSKGIRTR
ncbi:MAG: hypothetical protein DDT32_02361 [Syntrophomonadaceae bacterium]|nr:hypothetical protein [Bacillota bacterium]